MKHSSQIFDELEFNDDDIAADRLMTSRALGQADDTCMKCVLSGLTGAYFVICHIRFFDNSVVMNARTSGVIQ